MSGWLKITYLLFWYLCMAVAVAQPAPDARALFTRHNSSIYQIQVIDLAANNKSSTGSGFLVDQSGLVATNFHVIASLVDKPDDFKIEVIDSVDRIIHADLVVIDMVNDLAILKIDSPDFPVLELSEAVIQKGDTAYSMGYPYDLGITVVPGTYNGFASHSAKKIVHFTGSLNPGMSGGPAFNAQGEVIGVNVSTAGNQLSFLVPVEYLSALLLEAKKQAQENFLVSAAKQLKENSDRLIAELMEGNWETVPLGGAFALDEVTRFLRCWGSSKKIEREDDETPFWAERSCQTDHNIFVNNQLTTGKIELQFYWIETQHLSSLQFYNYYEKIFRNYRAGNYGSKDDLGPWVCAEEFVTAAEAENMITKAVFCTRAYKKLEGIFDILFLQGSVTDLDQAHMIHFTIAGATMESALRFTEKFTGSSVW